MIGRTILCALAAPVLAGVAAAAPAGPDAPAKPTVEVRVEKIAYPVRHGPLPREYPDLKTNAALAGKETYTTEAVVLENEYVRATVLPEFGARLVRVVFKKANRDLFWVNDALADAPPWSMGGARFSFPYPDDGRHMDEAAGWRIARNSDGSATVAMDMRFTPYKGETGRYGRFSVLRQATFVTLRPGSAALEYVARIDNPLPLRHGFRLWSVAHFPRQDGAAVLFPAGAVTDSAASKRSAWPVFDDVDHSRLGTWDASCFAAAVQGDWTGVYYGDADANHLILKPRFTAPGTRLHVAPAAGGSQAGRSGPMIEIWNGSNPTFDHPGHYLPPFGTYILPLKLVMPTGIGRIDWAGDTVAVAYEPRASGGTVRVVAYETHPGCRLMARTSQETVKTTGTLGPDKPLVLELTKPARTVLLTVIDAEDNEVAEASLPWRPAPTPAETVQAIAKEMKPWTWLAMELADWPHDQQANIADAAKALAERLATDPIERVLHAARMVMRTETPGSPRWQAVRGKLDVAAGRQPQHRYAQAYLGLMLALEARGKMTPEAARHAAVAERLPAGHYLLALDALATGKTAKAASHLKRCAAEAPPVSMGLGENALEGNDRLHPAALPGGEWPDLMLAATLIELQQPAQAIAELERLLMYDPARPEALLLLADAYSKAGQEGKAQAARNEAKALLRGNEQAQKDYGALIREVRLGEWSGIARP
jgi:tetratricopeptide (TPR) repeat protein